MSKPLFERTKVNQIRLHVLPTKRFKTYAISVYLGSPLSESTVTPFGLIPFVLRRGSMKYPDTKQFREKLDDMYGAGFGFDVVKRGDHQIIKFQMDVINDHFVNEKESLLKQSMQFLGSTITNPYIENDAFSKTYVSAEKNTVQKRIEGLINDKIRYAAERCIQEMCKNEPYRLYALGQISDLQKITSSTLYEEYKRWLRDAVIDIYVVGDTSLNEVQSLIEQYFPIHNKQQTEYEAKERYINSSQKQIKSVVEELDVTQGKLNMGLRANVTYSDTEYPTALMYNGILGSFPHSKLFVNVREKESLAYYSSSRFEGHKGIITIHSGIEINNYDKAVEIIKKQIDDLRNGVINDIELTHTKAMISNQLQEIQDSAFEMIGFDFNNILSGKERTSEELIQEINEVNVQAISAFAEKVDLETIYFLRDKKGES
ncbi:EF-P 5-aminopentanol modification-associated protein YfmF [Chengkuizengella axinellae]|uniref:Pitrilysin family protein n=1 Tax=Chengkuizengella axinellae TaxID=3064388 RepID=A0ABT9IVW7_9BACL|nr:pitrilysin family protein [Chengkuizengella sp. 2205SS18-9]MDP5273504.1 pitrilysin family protein [Chengkuizengella sp. 2205SS18-9]